MARSKVVSDGTVSSAEAKQTANKASPSKQRKKGTQRSGEVPANSQVYSSVKQQLLDGYYRPGTWLSIDDLASQFGVSRQPVMDAIKRLTIEGFIEIVPQVGSRVRQYSANDITNFFDLFALTESHIARTAALRADPDDILELRLISAQLGVLTKIDSKSYELLKLYRSLNRKLHAALSNSTKSPLLGEMVEGLRDRADFFITTYAGLDQRLADAISEHEEIVDAIATRQPDKAGEIMLAHVLAFKPEIPE
ncbi:GntR family transcriptional regulator [Paraburkholderia aspalathi]|nr:GntR family transcriptional regulator [Paraburkholderia aspalathi]